ncbi:MAG: HU family DNA-binding protein [Paracoccaceae bacterium]|nr:HU family DNA-binding protein [Paracoccaceae bacterium]
MATTRAANTKKTTSRTAPPPAEATTPATLRKRELIERVTAETGLKWRDVKAIADAVLSVMGQAVGEGQTLALEPLGKLRVARTAENGAARVLTCKLRQKPLVAAGE